MSTAARPRRLFVTGGSRLSQNAAVLWHKLGSLLAQEDSLIVITGGLEKRADDLYAPTADSAMVKGFAEGLKRRGIDAFERIETILPDPGLDPHRNNRFHVGRVLVQKKRTAQSRRFLMVHNADVVIAIEGDTGTRSVLDLALAINRPVLSVPYGGGSSEKIWKEEKEGVCAAFKLTPKEVHSFDSFRFGDQDLDDSRLLILAKEIRNCVLRGFSGSCFVIMPFQEEFDVVYDKVIDSTLRAYGFIPFRTDRHVLSGNLVEKIRDGLKHCHFAIADVTGERPNVMYELGMAHAYKKNVILLRRESEPDG